jgi:hypothetical protein
MKLIVAALGLVLVTAGCGVVGSDPSIAEVQGWVDSACTAVPTAQDISCGVHLILLNTGGTGSGYMLVGVPVNGAGGATAKPVQCTAAIPVMAEGEYAETSCSVVLSKGTVVAAPPLVVSLKVGSESAPANDPTTVNAILIALAALILAALIWVGLEVRALRGQSAQRGRDDPDADYNLPRMPQ